MKTYNDKTKAVPRFKISFTNAWTGENQVNLYVTRRAAERNLCELQVAGHKTFSLRRFKMLNFNEYIPAGGWVRFNKRRVFKRRVFRVACSALGCAVLLGFYALVGYVERGI